MRYFPIDIRKKFDTKTIACNTTMRSRATPCHTTAFAVFSFMPRPWILLQLRLFQRRLVSCHLCWIHSLSHQVLWPRPTCSIDVSGARQHVWWYAIWNMRSSIFDIDFLSWISSHHSVQLFCIVTVLFESRVGNIYPSFVVRIHVDLSIYYQNLFLQWNWKRFSELAEI